MKVSIRVAILPYVSECTNGITLLWATFLLCNNSFHVLFGFYFCSFRPVF